MTWWDSGIWIYKRVTNPLRTWWTSSPKDPLLFTLALAPLLLMTPKLSARYNNHYIIISTSFIIIIVTIIIVWYCCLICFCLQNVIDAVIQSGQRALISPGWAKLGNLLISFLIQVAYSFQKVRE